MNALCWLFPWRHWLNWDKQSSTQWLSPTWGIVTSLLPCSFCELLNSPCMLIKLAQLLEASSACFTADNKKNIPYLTMLLLQTTPTVCAAVSVWTTMAWFVCLYFVTWCTGRCLLNRTVIGSGEEIWHRKKKKQILHNKLDILYRWMVQLPRRHRCPPKHCVGTLQAHKTSWQVQSELGSGPTSPARRSCLVV